MRRAVFVIALLAFSSALAGCARLNLKPTFRQMGEADPAAESAVYVRYRTLQEQGGAGQDKSGDQSEVKVLVNALPRGLMLDGQTLTVEEGYGHEIVGSFKLAPEVGFFPPYRDSWRKYVCYPQRPLVILSLTLWALVPIYYPCFTTTTSTREEVLKEVRAFTRAAGGDLAIISYLRSLENEEAQGATGFILRLDPRMKDGPLPTTPERLEAKHGMPI